MAPSAGRTSTRTRKKSARAREGDEEADEQVGGPPSVKEEGPASPLAPNPTATPETKPKGKGRRKPATKKGGAASLDTDPNAPPPIMLAPDYTANPAGPASSADTHFKCPQCDKVYKGKHARSIWRRHLQDKHGIPLSSQPRRTRWDNDANRPKSEEERRARTLDSKRRWARKARADRVGGTDAAESSTAGTPGRDASASADGRDDGEWEEDAAGEWEDEQSGRSRSGSTASWRDAGQVQGLQPPPPMVERAGSAPLQAYPTIYGRGGAIPDDRQGGSQQRPALRASQSSTLAAFPSADDSRQLLHRENNSYSQPQHAPPLRAPPHWAPHGHHPQPQPHSHYNDPYGSLPPLPPLHISTAQHYSSAPMQHYSNGPLSAPLYPSNGDGDYYRSSAPLDSDARASLAHTLQRPSSTSALPQPYSHPASTAMTSSLSHYATRRQASPFSHSRSRSHSRVNEMKSPIRQVAAESTEDAAGVLLALKMASPASSIRHSPPPTSRQRDWNDDDDDDDDEDDDEGPGNLSLESGDASFSFSAGNSTIRQESQEEDRSPPSSSSALSASESNNWPHTRPEPSTSNLSVAVSPRKRAASGSPESAGGSPHAVRTTGGNLASARKGRGMSFGQYASLTATPTPGMRIAMESSPVVGRGGRDDDGDLEESGAREGDLEEDEEEDLGSSERRRRSNRPRRGTNDGSPSRKARGKALGTSSSSSGRKSSRDRSSGGELSSSSAHRHSHYPPRRLEPPLPLHHHHPVGLSSDLGGFNLSSSSSQHPSSSSRGGAGGGHDGEMPPPHPTSSSILSTPAGPSHSNGASNSTAHDYYRPFAHPPSSASAALAPQAHYYPLSTHHGLSSPPSGYLFSSPAHPGISKQLGLTAQPGPGVFIGGQGETPGRGVVMGQGAEEGRRWSIGSSGGSKLGRGGGRRRGSDEDEEDEEEELRSEE
ncbi:hypothetical protein BCR35DRAFT_306643 [Leucosporidium creatinivorum]|uniref:Uncharacterized protein n=1 Tax=Leucosporidium creatinivorum TaxID=106004 RepID=A0A1Y2ESI0_9BASI|nr:hypothetical protein BCR35DRAFT_306643 [Leucosporidium creatinivorum]